MARKVAALCAFRGHRMPRDRLWRPERDQESSAQEHEDRKADERNKITGHGENSYTVGRKDGRSNPVLVGPVGAPRSAQNIRDRSERRAG